MIPFWHKYSWLLFFGVFSAFIPTQYASADTVYSVNNNDTVSYISTSDDSVTSPISLVSGSKPTAICLNPITPRAYTLNSGTNTISVIDTALRTVVDTISSARFTEIVSIACNPTGTSVLIGNNTTSSTSNILYLNTATLTLDSGETSVDSNPGSIVFNRNGSKAYILSRGGSSLTTINMATQLVAVGPVPLTEAEAPFVLAMHTQDNYLYVLNLLGSTVALYNPETLALYKTISTGMFPTNIVVSSTTNLLYVVNSDNTVSLINPALETLLTTISADASAAIIERNDGQKVYTASQYELINPIFSYATSDFTATTGQITLPDGSSPQALATLLGTRHNLDLTISGDGSGSVNWPFNTVYPLTNNGIVGVPEGISVTVEAKANACSTVNWIGCDSVSGGGTLTAACSANPFTTDKHINAILTPSIHNVTTTVANGTGSISCSSLICYGDSSVCTITPGVGYSLNLADG